MNEDDALLILDLFAASDWDDLSLASGDVRLSVSKRPGGAAPLSVPPARPAAVPAPVPAAPSPVVPAGDELPAGMVPVRSPTLGTFFAAPKPGAPPFVSEGVSVAAGDTLAIVEVMKLMNPVKADVGGEVVRVCARNNELVEYDRVLFWIKPFEGTV